VNLDPSSVLGNPGNTTALLEYCRDNHITHIVLYNCSTLLILAPVFRLVCFNR
jgi:hypothetical protein